MKCLEKVKDILKKYDFTLPLPEGVKTVYEFEEKPDWLKSKKRDGYFMDKYDKHIPQGWYGFALGSPTPKVWLDALDEVLALLILHDPAFEIHQIKTKFGGVRFYVESELIEDIWDIESLIEDTMFDKALIY